MSLLMAALNHNHVALDGLLDLALKEKNELIRSAAVRILVDNSLENKEEFYVNIIRVEHCESL